MNVMRTGTACSLLTGVSLLWGGVAAAQPAPEVGLNKCQNAVRTETAKYIKSKETAIGVCLQHISTQPNDADNEYAWWGTCTGDGVTNCGTDADCSLAAGTCNAGAPSGNFVGQTIFQQVAALNTANFGGHNDWRVPNIKELQSIVDCGQLNPALNAAFHGASCGASCTDLTDPSCSCDAASPYWSSTSFATNPAVAWYLYSNDGGVGNYGIKGNAVYVRAVRGGL